MSDTGYRQRIPRNEPSVSSTGITAIVVSVLFLAAGFFVLRTINSEHDTVTSLGNGSNSEVGAMSHSGMSNGSAAPGGSVVGGTTLPALPTTVPIPETYTGATIVVANANDKSGSAGDATTVLKSVTGFTLGEPTNAIDDLKLEASKIYYSTASDVNKQVADTLSRVLKGIVVEPLPQASPVKGNLGDAGVVLMLGNDLKSLTANDLVQPYKLGAVPAASVPAVTVPVSATG